MSCSDCNTNHPSNTCPDRIRFDIDETYLVPSCAGYPISPVNLAPIVTSAETDTRFQLDIANQNLVYTGEKASNNLVAADTVAVADVANLINLRELGDVDYQVSTNGDLLSWDSEQDAWVSYTIPSETIVTPVGVGADGNLVKDGSGGTPQAPDTVPLGGMIDWPGDINAIPVSYRECNGQALSRAVYSDLFAILGTRYGSGDGSTTFNLPNLRGRQVTGYNPNDTQFNVIGQTGGSKTASLSSANNGPHTHSGNTNNAGAHTHTSSRRFIRDVGGNSGNLRQTSSGAPEPWQNLSELALNSAGNHNHSFTTNSSGSGTPFSILDPYIALPKIMRVI